MGSATSLAVVMNAMLAMSPLMEMASIHGELYCMCWLPRSRRRQIARMVAVRKKAPMKSTRLSFCHLDSVLAGDGSLNALITSMIAISMGGACTRNALET